MSLFISKIYIFSTRLTKIIQKQFSYIKIIITHTALPPKLLNKHQEYVIKIYRMYNIIIKICFLTVNLSSWMPLKVVN